MKKIKKILLFGIFAILCYSCTWNEVPVEEEDDPVVEVKNPFIGTWTAPYEIKDDDGNMYKGYMTFTFFDDMTCVMELKFLVAPNYYETNTVAMQYEYDDKQIAIYNDDSGILFEYHITGNKMSCIDDEGTTLLFTKQP